MKRIVIAITAIFLYIVMALSVDFYHKVYPVTGMDGSLASQLLQYSEEIGLDPQEPRIDPIWHFVPGLKGVEVDYGLSYQNINAAGSFEEGLVVKKYLPYEKNPEEFRQEPIYRGNEKGKYVSLLINVAWGETELNKMIEILDRLEVKANFFFEGRYAEDHSYQVAKVYNQGHVVGNHSFSHPACWGKLDYEGFEEEIVRTNEILSGITGQPTLYFAPPGGEFNDQTLKAAYDQGMYTVLWTADTIDWKGGSVTTILNRIRKKVEPGALILMHPKEATVEALEPLIRELLEKGYRFKTMHEIVFGDQLDCINNEIKVD